MLRSINITNKAPFSGTRHLRGSTDEICVIPYKGECVAEVRDDGRVPGRQLPSFPIALLESVDPVPVVGVDSVDGKSLNKHKKAKILKSPYVLV